MQKRQKRLKDTRGKGGELEFHYGLGLVLARKILARYFCLKRRCLPANVVYENALMCLDGSLEALRASLTCHTRAAIHV